MIDSFFWRKALPQFKKPPQMGQGLLKLLIISSSSVWRGLAEPLQLAWPQLLQGEVGSAQPWHPGRGELENLPDFDKVSPGGSLMHKDSVDRSSGANWKCLILCVWNWCGAENIRRRNPSRSIPSLELWVCFSVSFLFSNKLSQPHKSAVIA